MAAHSATAVPIAELPLLGGGEDAQSSRADAALAAAAKHNLSTLWHNMVLQPYLHVTGLRMACKHRAALALQVVLYGFWLLTTLGNSVQVAASFGPCMLGATPPPNTTTVGPLGRPIADIVYEGDSDACFFRVMAWMATNLGLLAAVTAMVRQLRQPYLYRAVTETVHAVYCAPNLDAQGNVVDGSASLRALSAPTGSRARESSHALLTSRIRGPLDEVVGGKPWVHSWNGPAEAERVYSRIWWSWVFFDLWAMYGGIEWYLTGFTAWGVRSLETSFADRALILLQSIAGQGSMVCMIAVLSTHSRVLVLRIEATRALARMCNSADEAVAEYMDVARILRKASKVWGLPAAALIVAALGFVCAQLMRTLSYVKSAGHTRGVPDLTHRAVPSSDGDDPSLFLANEIFLLGNVFLICKAYVDVNAAVARLRRDLTRDGAFTGGQRLTLQADVDALKLRFQMLGMTLDQKLFAALLASMLLAKAKSALT